MQKKNNYISSNFLLFFILVLISFVSYLFFFQKKFTERNSLGQNQGVSYLRTLPDHSIIEWEVSGKKLMVEVVNTGKSIEKGLGERESLDGADGMLFVFEQFVRPGFWMKGMMFPIDLYWIQSGRVIGSEKNMIPVSEEKLQLFYPPEKVDMVLEIPVSKGISLE